MKKVFQKNQIAITALAIMIAVAGYQKRSLRSEAEYVREKLQLQDI